MRQGDKAARFSAHPPAPARPPARPPNSRRLPPASQPARLPIPTQTPRPILESTCKIECVRCACVVHRMPCSLACTRRAVACSLAHAAPHQAVQCHTARVHAMSRLGAGLHGLVLVCTRLYALAHACVWACMCVRGLARQLAQAAPHITYALERDATRCHAMPSVATHAT